MNKQQYQKTTDNKKITDKKKITETPFPFPDEVIHLEETTQKLDTALQRAAEDVRRIDREYRDSKRYMAEYRGEIDPHEMFQNELLLKQTDHTGAFAVSVRDKLAKLKDSPYFARIDFQEDGQEPSRLYIGRFTFNFENEMLIFDWRAPVAAMFYDYELGPAGYYAPDGRINGILTKKRQFKIKEGLMEYALESSSHVQDDILQRELSHTSDEKMKSIISTIQREQNQIIRGENTGTLIIQGAAGSGKTSIALHRIAFLLYRLKDRLNARNVTILSPNKVFGDYISGVIPELGEEPVYEIGLTEIAEIQLEKVIGFEPDKDPLDTSDEAWTQRVRFKSTSGFVQLMDAYIKELPGMIFSPDDYTFGRFTADKEWIRRRFMAYGTYPVRQRLTMTAEDICSLFESDNIMEDDLPGPKQVLKALTSMLTIKTPLALYKDFYNSTGNSGLFTMPAKKTLEWADVYPFLYLYSAFAGLKESRITKHLVVDEMQDYSPIQYRVLNKIFPCQKTILGDFGQLINPNHIFTLTDLRGLYEGAQFVELKKSYRSTFEIMTFAKQIQNHVSLEPVERHGEAPDVIYCRSEDEELRRIKTAIRDFKHHSRASLGIILKTNREARELFDTLPLKENVSLITPESSRFQNGVSITSIQMSKGLEFDEVIIPKSGQAFYHTDYDRNLLYIACTRAMHRLTLLYTDERSQFIPSEPEHV